MATTLAAYLKELKALGPEKPLEPELKDHRQQQDKQIREELDLQAGAVLIGTVQEGHGEGHPREGDLVFIHYSIRDTEADSEPLLYSTRPEEGGAGLPLGFRLGKGSTRAPRAWEIALKDMRLGQRCLVKARGTYGYEHPDCTLTPPAGYKIPTGQTLGFDITLTRWYPAEGVSSYGDADLPIIKRVLQEGTGWDAPRPPFEVTLHLTASTLATDGAAGQGSVYYSSRRQGSGAPLQLQLGEGLLPPGVEQALSHMSKGERALLLLPAPSMQPPQQEGQSGGGQPCALPAPPSKAAQVEVEVELLAMVQVRDMTGDGQVLKRRLREGEGEFPIDCPLTDTTVRIHFRARVAPAQPGAEPGPWVYDSRAATGGQPLELDTGCGEAPEAVEMAAKLMVPGELALVACTHRYAYAGRDDAPAGLAAQDAQASTSGRGPAPPPRSVEFEVELVSFDREGHWQAMAMVDRFALAERTKAKANALLKAGKYTYAQARYERLHKLMDSTRDYETNEEVERMDALKLAVLSNLALCHHHAGDYVAAVQTCSRALQHDPESAKLLLRRGRALSMKGNFEEAEEDMLAAKGLAQAEHDAGVAAAAAGGKASASATGAAQGEGEEGSRPAAPRDPAVALALVRDAERELAANRQRARAATEKQRREFGSFFK